MGFGEFLVVEVLVFGVLGLIEFLGIGSERVVEGFLFVFGRFKGELLKSRYCLGLHVREREREKVGLGEGESFYILLNILGVI